MSTAASNTPPKKPIQSGGVFAALRRKKNVINANEGELEAIVSSGERLANWCALLIFAGLVTEAILVFVPLSPFGVKVGAFVTDSLIAAGVFGELFFHNRSSHAQGELMRRSNDRLAEIEFANGFLEEKAAMAVERAAKAELETEQLRAKIAPRALTKEQFDALQGLKGKVSKVYLMMDSDSEVLQFGMQIVSALLKQDIEVKWLTAPLGWPSQDIQVWLPESEMSSSERHPLAVALNKAGLGGLVMSLANISLDVPRDVPIIRVGGKRLVYEALPYFGDA
jgi:hypothetical protein